MGFYTTRFVEADTPENAENLAVQLIREDAIHQAVVNAWRASPPLKTSDEIYFYGDASAPGSSAILKISVVSSWHALSPMLQLILIVFFATTSELST